METQWIKTFIVAAKYENYRLAAEELFISQPAVTKHIQNLEKKLGAALFIRDNKRIVLNANGAQFLPIGKKIIATYEEGIQAFQDYLKGYIREVKIGVAPQIANSILPFVLKEFARVYPTVQVTVEVMKSNEIASAIHQGKIHIGISKLEPIYPLLVQEIMEEPIVMIVPKVKQHESMENLMQHEKILTHEYAPYWEQVQLHIQAQYPSATYMKVNQTETIKHFVRQGLGIAFLPKSVASFGIATEEITIRQESILEGCTSKTYFISKYATEDSEQLLSLCQSIYAQKTLP